MPEPAVHNWDKVIHKNVRRENNQSVGNIVAVETDHIIVTSQGGMSSYRIPKSFVEHNGAEVIVKLPRIALDGFKM